MKKRRKIYIILGVFLMVILAIIILPKPIFTSKAIFQDSKTGIVSTQGEEIPLNINPIDPIDSEKVIILNITRQDGFEKYIDISSHKENATRFVIIYKLNETLLNELNECSVLSNLQKTDCLTAIKDKYLSKIDNTELTTSVDALTAYPINVLTLNLRAEKNNFDLTKEGYFYVDLLNYDEKNISKSVGEKMKIGFNSIISQTVESTNDVGFYSSIALDSKGVVHISHGNIDSTFNLRYCNNSGGSWSCVVADSTAISGKHTSIAIDSNDKVHISHLYDSVKDLRYCNNTGGTWSCTTVESTNLVGLYSSIAIDSNDKVHISHFDDTNDDLRYCNNTASNGAWSCTTVDTSGNMGKYSSIAIDSNNKVHISHFDNSGFGLRYCSNTGGSWVCSTLDWNSNPGVGRYTSIAIDSNNKVHISYSDAVNINVDYCNNVAGWSCSPVGIDNWDMGYSSIAVDANNKIHISHYWNSGSPPNYLRYCNNTAGSWTCSSLVEVDTNSLGQPNGRNLVIKRGRIVDSQSFSGKYHISYYSQTDLFYYAKDYNSCEDYSSGNWVVNCSDECVIVSNVVASSNIYNFTAVGSGTFRLNANISKFKTYTFGGGCNAYCTAKGCIKP